MEDKDIEKLLKESAEEVKVKDFSERWEKLKGRIDSAQEAALKETTSETVLATSANGNLSQNSIKKKFIISLSAVFLVIVICLAIVLPITLRTNDSPIDPPIDPPIDIPKFFDLQDLEKVDASENEFYSKLEEADLKIVSLEKFAASNFILLYTEDNDLVGGRVEFIDEVDGVIVECVFYDSTVKSKFDIGTDFKTYSTNGASIEYHSELTDDYYTVLAKAVKNNISYEFDCMAGDENVENFFDKLFS